MLEELLKNFSPMMNNSFRMSIPNENIDIYKGEFKLIVGNEKIHLKGWIKYTWLPHPVLRFLGESEKVHDPIYIASHLSESVDLSFDSYILKASITSFNRNEYKGILDSPTIHGHSESYVEEISFVIPNLKEIYGQNDLGVVNRSDKQIQTRSRIQLHNSAYKIILEQNLDHNVKQKLLTETGGYIIQYNGRMSKPGELINIEEAREVLECLNYFLSFINGRRTSALFLNGLIDNKAIWTDWTSYDVSSYQTVASWYSKKIKLGINELWNAFYTLWIENNERDYLKNVIDLYLDSNSNKLVIESCIMLTQIAFELLFNWNFIDVGKLSKKENEKASWKISRLLNESKIPIDIPKSLPYLKEIVKLDIKFADGVKNLIDNGPKAITEIRNTIIHGNKWRSENLDKISTDVRVDIWILGNWYLELLLLNKLNYQGDYNNRSASIRLGEACIDKVPWAKEYP